jgi:hypothetical protein
MPPRPRATPGVIEIDDGIPPELDPSCIGVDNEGEMAPPPRKGKPLVVLAGDGAVSVVWPIYRHRFMFSNGAVLDVNTASDGTVTRRAILDHAALGKGQRIAGISEGTFVGWTAAEPVKASQLLAPDADPATIDTITEDED